MAFISRFCHFSGNAGKLIHDIIDSGFLITALSMFNLVHRTATEFLTVSRGQLEPDLETILELISGPCIVLEVKTSDSTTSFSDFCGPTDPVSCEPCEL